MARARARCRARRSRSHRRRRTAVPVLRGGDRGRALLPLRGGKRHGGDRYAGAGLRVRLSGRTTCGQTQAAQEPRAGRPARKRARRAAAVSRTRVSAESAPRRPIPARLQPCRGPVESGTAERAATGSLARAVSDHATPRVSAENGPRARAGSTRRLRARPGPAPTRTGKEDESQPELLLRRPAVRPPRPHGRGQLFDGHALGRGGELVALADDPVAVDALVPEERERGDLGGSKPIR